MTTEKNAGTGKPVLDLLGGKTPHRTPFWLMRQAGRYLPEYRALRSEAGGFLDLVYDPEKASEVTLQPLRRFGMDAAILFSDILVVPHALGQDVRFEAGEGPRLNPVRSLSDLASLNLDAVSAKASPVYETVALCRKKMSSEGMRETTMIGFCGAPWTVACYMVEGRGSRDFDSVRLLAHRDPAFFATLIDLIVAASCAYLSGQIAAGAEVVKIFDSWAGVLDAADFHAFVIEPTKKIIQFLKANHPDIPVIGFPRGAGAKSLAYAKATGVDCLAIDQSVDPAWAAEHLQPVVTVQGNLDPVRLLVGGEALDEGLRRIHDTLGRKPFLFNLGHGVIKETPPEHVARLAQTVRAWKGSAA